MGGGEKELFIQFTDTFPCVFIVLRPLRKNIDKNDAL